MALRVLGVFGLDPNKDFVRERFGASESAGALRDKKIDAYFWVGGLPTASVTDLGMTPRVKLKLIGHADVIPKMRETYGPLYVKGVIPAKTYPGQTADIPIAVVWNVLVCHENMKENLSYGIVKTLFSHKAELMIVHSEGKNLMFEPQRSGGSPIPFHPGAIRYFSERGLKTK
jgi:TRAP transporter TAXI family solute receptor